MNHFFMFHIHRLEPLILILEIGTIWRCIMNHFFFLRIFLHTAEYTGSWQGFPIILSSFLTNGRQGGKNYISIFHSFLVLACVTIFWGKRREVYFWGEVDYPQPIFFSFIFCKYSEILKRNKSLKI